MKKVNFKMKKRIWVISNLTLLVILLFSSQAHSAIRYVTENGSGNMSGIDWSNSYSGMPSLLQRGDIYYLADGSYGAYTFADQVSGATFIFIKKATLTDYGTQVGWQNSMGDSAAVFSNLQFTSDY